MLESATQYVLKALEVMDPEGLLESLDERIRWQFWALCWGLAAAGLGRARVIEARRSLDRQKRLWAQGRTGEQCRKAGVDPSWARPDLPRVTWIPPHQGKHVQGRAVDLSFAGYHSEQIAVAGWVAKALGVTWGGYWKVRDYGHFEV